MNAKGLEPPPNATEEMFASLGETLFSKYLYFLDRWFQVLQSKFAKTETYSVPWNPTNVGANTTSEQTVTVNGLQTSDIVYVNKPSHQSGLGVVNARVSAANTLAVTFMNTTGAGIDPANETYLVVAIRR